MTKQLIVLLFATATLLPLWGQKGQAYRGVTPPPRFIFERPSETRSHARTHTPENQTPTVGIQDIYRERLGLECPDPAEKKWVGIHPYLGITADYLQHGDIWGEGQARERRRTINVLVVTNKRRSPINIYDSGGKLMVTSLCAGGIMVLAEDPRFAPVGAPAGFHVRDADDNNFGGWVLSQLPKRWVRNFHFAPSYHWIVH